MTRTPRRETDRIRTEIVEGIAEFYEAKAADRRVRRCGTMIASAPAWGAATSIVVPGIPRSFGYLFSPRASPQAYLN